MFSTICVTELYWGRVSGLNEEKLAHLGSQFLFDFRLVLMMSLGSDGFTVPLMPLQIQLDSSRLLLA